MVSTLPTKCNHLPPLRYLMPPPGRQNAINSACFRRRQIPDAFAPCFVDDLIEAVYLRQRPARAPGQAPCVLRKARHGAQAGVKSGFKRGQDLAMRYLENCTYVQLSYNFITARARTDGQKCIARALVSRQKSP